MAIDDSAEHAVELGLVSHPVPRHQGKSHGPEPPPQERHLLELGFGEPSTAPEHPGPERQRLDHVEVAPADMVGHDDGALALGQRIPGRGDARAVERFKDELDPAPHGEGDARGEMVDGIWEQALDGQKQGEQDIGDQEPDKPWESDKDPAEVGYRRAGRRGHDAASSPAVLTREEDGGADPGPRHGARQNPPDNVRGEKGRVGRGRGGEERISVRMIWKITVQ